MIPTIKKQVVIVGGGPAGLAAACEFAKHGIKNMIILEREQQLGGILRQCIHDGFGIFRFGKALTGPEYAQHFIDEIENNNIEYSTNTTVLNISADKTVTAVSRNGIVYYQADIIVLAMGCRERTRGALSIPGARPTGVFTAGVAQAYINLKNKMIGKNIIILGSGDIGLIMARRLTLEGAKVHGVFEIKPYPNGLPRNIEQCLNDFDIPLFTSHTVTNIKGNTRVESVTISRVDENLIPIPGTEKIYPCDTLILSVGLIPENELSRNAGITINSSTNGPEVNEFYMTNIPGIFAAGNVLHVHDLADYVSEEAENIVSYAIEFLKDTLPCTEIKILPGKGIQSIVPQHISGKNDVTLYFRVSSPVENAKISVFQTKKELATASFKKLLPAQMNKILLPAKALCSTDEIQVVIKYD